jgi:hypothetical protein
MATTFYIVLNLKTAWGLEPFGQFDIGNDSRQAHNLFAKLKGNEDITEDDLLIMQFMETRDGLPVNVDLISCTGQQLEENCGIITKEMFKRFNLDFFSKREE